MIKINVVRELPINLKPSAINEIYKTGNKLLYSLGNVSELVDVGDKYAICIKNSPVLDVLSYIWRILSSDKIVHLEDL